MEISEEVQKKINTFAEQCHNNEKRRVDAPLDPINIEEYNRSLDETLGDLQDRLQKQEAALQNVCCYFPKTCIYEEKNI